MLKPAPTIGLFYGSSTCYTEMAAEKIRDTLSDFEVELHNLAEDNIAACLDYPIILFGAPTWDYGELQEDWENQWDAFAALDFSGKTVALFGLGDQIGYPEWFLDAMGYIHRQAIANGARAIGFWPNSGYDFTESQALTEDREQFVGLALDEENQAEQSASRIRNWCDQIRTELSQKRDG